MFDLACVNVFRSLAKIYYLWIVACARYSLVLLIAIVC